MKMDIQMANEDMKKWFRERQIKILLQCNVNYYCTIYKAKGETYIFNICICNIYLILLYRYMCIYMAILNMCVYLYGNIKY